MTPTVLAPAAADSQEPRARKLTLVDGGARQVRVLLAHDHALVRAGIRGLLETAQFIAVVAEAASGEQAIADARRLAPDVVLIDPTLTDVDVETIGQIAGLAGVRVMILSPRDTDGFVFSSLRAGASAVLAHDADAEELVRAVRVVAGGQPVLSPSLTRSLIAELVSRPEPTPPGFDALAELTPREREVVELVALGLKNDEIAARLVLSPATAKTHVSRAMLKVHARDRAQLVVFAYQAGLVRTRGERLTSDAQPLALVT